MARQDIANMLTGMGGGSTRPNPNMSSSDWRMAFGAQQAQGLMNAARTTTPQEAIQMGIGNLNLESVKGLQTLAQMQQIRGDMAGAAQTVSQIKAMQEKQTSEQALQERRANFIPFLAKEYPNLVSLAQGANPVVTPENYKNFTDKADSLTPDQKNWMLARKQGDTRNFTQWKDRNVADQSASLTKETKNYRIAVEQGYTGTQLEFMDRNVTTNSDAATQQQKHLAQINSESGTAPILLSDYLDSIKKKVSGGEAKYNTWKTEIAEGNTDLSYLAWNQELSGKTTVAEKYETRTDGRGFLRYITGPDSGELVFPDVVETLLKEKVEKETENKAVKENTVTWLKNRGNNDLALRLEKGIISVADVNNLAEVDSRLLLASNDLVTDALAYNNESNKATDILLDFNELVNPGGTLEQVARDAKKWAGQGGYETVVAYSVRELTIKEANALAPAGPQSDADIIRSDSAIPSFKDGPKVMRSWLLGRAKKNALGAAQKAAQASAIQSGNIATFYQEWQQNINNPQFREKIYRDYGVPVSSTVRRKVINASNSSIGAKN